MPSAENPSAIWYTQNYYDEDAERISNVIDEGLKEFLKRKEERKREVRVLLLGQAESGKSTLQKQFQLFYASQVLERERGSWRPVVFLNVIRAVRAIFDSLEYSGTASVDGSPGSEIESEAHGEIARLRSQLQPLLAVENAISLELSGGLSGRASAYVRSGWQKVVARQRPNNDSSDLSEISPFHKTLGSAAESVEALWRHPLVTELAELRKLNIEDSAPFFLSHVHRISKIDYVPTTEDILNVRMRTLGVVEHSLSVHQGGIEYTWRMYDVGGARGQTCLDPFDNATAIIFLAPISAFDQHLDEDPGTNRIEDSLQLFKDICASPLLKTASLILLLNKVDLLQKKLQSGTKVNTYIPSYGNRKNALEEVLQYFRAHFKQMHRKHDPGKRVLFTHFTSMLDTKATHIVIGNVGDSIMHKYMSEMGLT